MIASRQHGFWARITSSNGWNQTVTKDIWDWLWWAGWNHRVQSLLSLTPRRTGRPLPLHSGILWFVTPWTKKMAIYWSSATMHIFSCSKEHETCSALCLASCWGRKDPAPQQQRTLVHLCSNFERILWQGESSWSCYLQQARILWSNMKGTSYRFSTSRW